MYPHVLAYKIRRLFIKEKITFIDVYHGWYKEKYGWWRLYYVRKIDEPMKFGYLGRNKAEVLRWLKRQRKETGRRSTKKGR